VSLFSLQASPDDFNTACPSICSSAVNISSFAEDAARPKALGPPPVVVHGNTKGFACTGKERRYLRGPAPGPSPEALKFLLDERALRIVVPVQPRAVIEISRGH
jgi:hypothetical protein